MEIINEEFINVLGTKLMGNEAFLLLVFITAAITIVALFTIQLRNGDKIKNVEKARIETAVMREREKNDQWNYTTKVLNGLESYIKEHSQEHRIHDEVHKNTNDRLTLIEHSNKEQQIELKFIRDLIVKIDTKSDIRYLESKKHHESQGG